MPPPRPQPLLVFFPLFLLELKLLFSSPLLKIIRRRPLRHVRGLSVQGEKDEEEGETGARQITKTTNREKEQQRGKKLIFSLSFLPSLPVSFPPRRSPESTRSGTWARPLCPRLPCSGCSWAPGACSTAAGGRGDFLLFFFGWFSGFSVVFQLFPFV